jgi:hypothetical protein
MESPERSLIIDVIMNSNTPKLYPQLSEVQKDRIFADLLQEYRLNNLRPVREPGDNAFPDYAP